MEYQKIANLLDNASNHPSRFRTKNCVEVKHDSRGTYTNADIKFKTTMLKSNLCDDAARQLDERDKGVSDNYSKISGSLWQYYRNDPNNNMEQSKSFKSKIKITGKTAADHKTKDVEILVLLKYLSNFWRTLEMPLMNCDVDNLLFLLQLEKQNLR